MLSEIGQRNCCVCITKKTKITWCEHDYGCACACSDFKAHCLTISMILDRQTRPKQSTHAIRLSETHRVNWCVCVNENDLNTRNECESHLLCIISNHRCPFNEWIFLLFFFSFSLSLVCSFTFDYDTLVQRIILYDLIVSVWFHFSVNYIHQRNSYWNETLIFRLHPATVL